MKNKILVIDDDCDLSFIISEMLENYEYHVKCAESGGSYSLVKRKTGEKSV